MRLELIQQALREAGIDGWLFYDFQHRDTMAYRILGLDAGSMATRRWFYYIPAQGEPVGLAHQVEPHKLDGLPGRVRHYRAWDELHQRLKEVVSGAARVAMQYSPMCNIPYVSVVDAGTVELIRSFGPEVVSSADMVQQFEAVLDAGALDSHRRAGDAVMRIKNEAFLMMDRALRQAGTLTENDVKEFILTRFGEEGLTAGDHVPIVGFNEHAADPHFEPTADNALTLHHGDTILVDLWARVDSPPGVFYDVTWCGFAGQDPPSLYQEIFDTVVRARDAAFEFVVGKFETGDACHGYEIDRVCRKVVDDAGYGEHFVHRTGHSIGIEDVHGNGANIDDLETRDERLIVPGLCFSIEPGIYLTGRMGVRSEIDVLITLDGKPEVYGEVQKELILIG